MPTPDHRQSQLGPERFRSGLATFSKSAATSVPWALRRNYSSDFHTIGHASAPAVDCDARRRSVAAADMYGRAIAATLLRFLAGFLTVTGCQRAGAATPPESAIAVALGFNVAPTMLLVQKSPADPECSQLARRSDAFRNRPAGFLECNARTASRTESCASAHTTSRTAPAPR